LFTELFDYLKYVLLTGMLSAQAFACAFAGTIDVIVLDPKGAPVPDVAVYLPGQSSTTGAVPGTAVMDQQDTRFVPHILVIRKGTSVEFPNSDVVAHHVYSFSKPNNFVLPLYKGDLHEPVTFEHDGIVTLGCNIHDHMLAYIVVVDTDAFGITGANGQVSIEVSDVRDGAELNIWSPRIRDKELSRTITNESASVTFSLKKKLRPPHDSVSEAVQWSEY
jgi:plastocyanin